MTWSQTECGNRTSTPPWSGSSKSGKLGKIRKFLERGATVIYHMLNLLTRSGRGFFVVICTPNLGLIPNRRLRATDGLVSRRIGSLCRRHCFDSWVHQRMNLFSGVFL